MTKEKLIEQCTPWFGPDFTANYGDKLSNRDAVYELAEDVRGYLPCHTKEAADCCLRAMAALYDYADAMNPTCFPSFEGKIAIAQTKREWA